MQNKGTSNDYPVEVIRRSLHGLPATFGMVSFLSWKQFTGHQLGLSETVNIYLIDL